MTQSPTPVPEPSTPVALAPAANNFAPVGERPAITYADVLTDKQKAVLRVRAEILGVVETDYDKLLAPDEKERLDELVRARMQSLASGE